MPINFGIVQTEIIWKTIDFVSIANYAVAKFTEYFFSSPELKAFIDGCLKLLSSLELLGKFQLNMAQTILGWMEFIRVKALSKSF